MKGAIKMARPQKKGLDYFPLDVDVFQDYKIKNLLSVFGAAGITLFFYVLCEIYRVDGYYLEVNDEFIPIVAEDLHIGFDDIENMLAEMLSLKLFDREIFDKYNIITSKDVQSRYMLAIKRRSLKAKTKVSKSLWLLNKSETEKTVDVIDQKN